MDLTARFDLIDHDITASYDKDLWQGGPQSEVNSYARLALRGLLEVCQQQQELIEGLQLQVGALRAQAIENEGDLDTVYDAVFGIMDPAGLECTPLVVWLQ